MSTRTADEFGCVAACLLKPGDRIVVSYGIITVKGIESAGAGRVTIVPVEEQPDITVILGRTFELK
jgi:hypothetical protein